MEHTIDLSSLLEPLTLALGGLLSTVALVAIRWLAARVGLEKLAADAHVRDGIEQLMARATNFGVAKLRDSGVTTVRTKNQMLGVAAQYAADAAPALLKRIGIDAGTLDGQRKLMGMVEARLLDKAGLIAVDVDGDGIPDKYVPADKAA